MTNAELIAKIKAEIERQEKQCPLDTYEGRHKLFILGGLKTFISTLESEKPIEGLEQEIQGKRKKLMEVFGPMNGEQVLALKDFARHFAQWGAEHLKETEL